MKIIRPLAQRIARGEAEPLLAPLPWKHEPIGWGSILRSQNPGGPFFVLHSARQHPVTGRYSWVLERPYLTFESRGHEMAITRSGKLKRLRGEPLSVIRKLLSEQAFDSLGPSLPPFLGGACGLFAYEFKNLIETSRAAVKDRFRVADIQLGFFDRGWVWDWLRRRAYAFVVRRTAGKAGHEAVDSLADMAYEWNHADIQTASSSEPWTPRSVEWTDARHFERMVIKAKRHIRRGDIYQANLSHAIQMRGEGDAYEVFRRQCAVNPSPFAAYADWGTHELVSGSPERLFKIRSGRISTRPIAGTRPKVENRLLDRWLDRELRVNPKEKAEHVMLVDLERNDLGRICRYGSVKVDTFMEIEEYSHVRHIISNVTGKLAKGRDAMDALRSLFPGGTITGAPKVRAMEIIDELEAEARGAYTGSLGYLSFDGSADFNIVIRSLWIQKHCAALRVGAGIVADSVPRKEYEETLAKAQAILQTLGIVHTDSVPAASLAD